MLHQRWPSYPFAGPRCRRLPVIILFEAQRFQTLRVQMQRTRPQPSPFTPSFVELMLDLNLCLWQRSCFSTHSSRACPLYSSYPISSSTGPFLVQQPQILSLNSIWGKSLILFVLFSCTADMAVPPVSLHQTHRRSSFESAVRSATPGPAVSLCG
jgi:hypothetical protein